jgi:hypothetical protein
MVQGQGSSTTFRPPVTYDSGGTGATSIAVADVNQDGKLDVVIANCDSTANACFQLPTKNGLVGVLSGNGDGTFQTAVVYDSGGLAAVSIAVADVNRDSRLDVVVANFFSNRLGVLLGNGDGTFQAAVTYGSGGVRPTSVVVADVNGDGRADLLAANITCDADPCPGGVVGVLLGNGDGTFQPAITHGGLNAQAVSVADVNGDGKPDLLIASGFFTVEVLIGIGNGMFATPVSYDSGGFGSRSVVVADVNGDGTADLVVANCASDPSAGCGGTSPNGVVGVLLGRGDGGFRTALTYDSGGKNDTSLAVSDVNGDHKSDLVVAHDCSDSGDCGLATGASC